MKKMFWAADLGSANRAKRSSITGRSETFMRIPTKSAGNSERRRPPVPIEAGRGF
jgi:hypothetical protein